MARQPLVPAPAAGNLRGIAMMLVASLFFASMHAAIRHVAVGGIHPFEIAFFRNVFGLLVVLPWALRYGTGVLRTQRLGLHTLRATVNTFSMLASFYALAIAPLAQITALGFSAPIFATLLATAVLGERVGIRRWSAILVGFAGTLVALKLGFGGIGLGPALAVGSAVASGISIVIVKVTGRTDSAVTITAYMSLLMAPASLAAAVPFWTWPTWHELIWLVGIGVAGNIGQILMAQALHDGDTNVVMPIDYLRLLWIAAIAYLAFGEVPDAFTWAGGAMIIASAAYIAYRERALARSKRRGGGAAAPTGKPPTGQTG